MRKVILMILAVVIGVTGCSSTPAKEKMAEWVEAGGNEESTAYVDTANIQRAGNMAKMWQLIDFKTTKKDFGSTYMSAKQQDEYDCKEKQWRTLYLIQSSGNMGKGESVYIETVSGKGEPVSPKSFQEVLWKIACGNCDLLPGYRRSHPSAGPFFSCMGS